MNHVVYLYGFVPSDAPTPPRELAGMDGRRVDVVELDGFGAAVSELDADRYGQASVQARLEDLAWVARRGARHETVVTWFADQATIVPARLFTIFSSEEALRAEAREHEGTIRERLVRFGDVREWDLKVSYDRSTLGRHLGQLSTDVAELDAELETAAPGRRYLLEQKRDELVRREAGAAARRLASDLLEELGGFADRVTELDLPDRRDDLPVVLNAALLVGTEAAADLQQRVATLAPELEEKGVHVALTGPWAPYRFMGEDADD